MQVKGELYYPTEGTEGDNREIEVDVIEQRDATARVPKVSSDIPFLRVDPPTVTERDHAKDPSLRARSYRFPIKLADVPPSEGFDGQVSTFDPWDASRVLVRNVHGDPTPAIRAVPSRLILVVGDADDAKPHARFLARAVRGRSPIRAEVEGGDSSPLQVEPAGGVDGAGYSAFEIRCKSGRSIAVGT